MNVAELTYEQVFGLTLNRDRVQGRLRHAVFEALCAFHAGRLSSAFFEPVANSKKEAEDMAFDFNAGKAMARAVAGKR